MADLYYIDDDYYTPAGYFVYTAQPNVAVESTATMTCTAGKIIQAAVENISLFDVGMVARVTSSASIDLDSESSLSALGEIVKTADVTLETIVSLSLQGDRIKLAAAALSTTADLDTDPLRYISYIATSPTPFYARGQALISTAQTKFGTHSLFLPDALAGAVSATTHSKFHIASDSDFSIALWYYPTANSAGTLDDIISWWDGTAGWILQRTSTRGLRFAISNAATSSILTTTNILTLNAWNWIVVTRTGTTLEIYVNGTQRATDTSSQATTSGNKTFRIGNITVNGGAVGYIDGLHVTIGSTIDTASPTADTLYATPESRLLMNWNDSSLGNWFDSSLSELQAAEAALSMTTDISASAARSRIGQSAIESQSELSVEGTLVAPSTANLSSNTALSAAAVKTVDADIALTAASTLSASAVDAVLFSSASVAIDSVRVRTSAVALNSITQVNVTANIIKTSAAALVSQGSVLAVGLDLDLASAALSAEFVQTTQAVKTTDNAADLVADATAMATVLRIKTSAVSMSSTATVAALVGVIKPLALSVSSTSTATAQPLRIKDLFLTGTFGQVYFDNQVSSSGSDYAVAQGDKFISVSSDFTPTPHNFRAGWAIAFWAAGLGYVWGGAIDHNAGNDENWVKFTEDDEIIYYFRTGLIFQQAVWTNINTENLNHYLLHGSNLYVNGQLQPSPTITTNGVAPFPTSLQMYETMVRGLAFTGEGSGWPGFTAIELTRTPGRGFRGALGQYVLWNNVLPANATPNFNLLTERQKLYNNGYVDIGSDGTATGLNRPREYIKLSNYLDLLPRGQDTREVQWRQFGTTFSQAQINYRQVLNYAATELDDVGPYTAISQLTAQPQSVLVNRSEMQSRSTVDATAEKFVGIIENLSSTVVQTTDIERFRTVDAALSAQGAKLTIAVKTGRTLVTLQQGSIFSAAAISQLQGAAEVNSSTVLVNVSVKTARISSNLQSRSEFGIEFTRIRPAASENSSTTTVSAQARKILSIPVSLAASSLVSANPFGLLIGDAEITASSTVTASAIGTFVGAAGLTSTANLACEISKIAGFDIDIHAFNIVLAIGSLVKIDPYYQLVVDRELRIKRILQETAIITVESELRLNTIRADNATITVPRETRTWHIPFSPQQGTRRVQ